MKDRGSGRRWHVGLATMLAWCLAVGAVAEDEVEQKGSVTELGIEWLSFHYEEPGTMKEYGSLYGVFYANTRVRGKLLIRMESSLVAGTILYDGALMDGTPYKVDTSDLIFKVSGIVGPTWPIGESGTTITPYIGLAYRYLVDDLPPPYGYLREQTYLYAPLGFMTMKEYGKWRFGIRAEYEMFLAGHNVSGGDAFTQDSGFGYQLSATLTYVQTDPTSFIVSVEPFYRYWDVAESTMSAGGYIEPENHSSLYGVRGIFTF